MEWQEITGRLGSANDNPTARGQLARLTVEAGSVVCRFKGEEVFRIAGDGTTPESRQQLVASLREMLLHLRPEDGAEIVEQGISVCFDEPDLAKLIETELAIKVVMQS